jgi:hypothetical protein
MKNHVIALLLLAGCAAPTAAQTTDVLRIRQDSPDTLSAEQSAMREGQTRIVGRMRERMPVETRITAGVPYSAEAITESTQILADGNRINRKTTTRVYRDSEGRTRRDQVSETGAVESTFIVDPRSGRNYVFEQRSLEGAGAGADTIMTSRREGPPQIIERKGNAGAFSGGDVIYENRIETRTKIADEADARNAADCSRADVAGAPCGLPRMQGRAAADSAGDGQTVRQDLGTSTIEGLAANGTLTTTTIPAGAIGNLQPIKIVSEEWFSPDLKVLVLTKHSDPRTGDTIYRLVNIVRAEPDASLFVVPDERNMHKSDIRNPDEGPK